MKQSGKAFRQHVVAMQCNSTSGIEGVGGLESTTKGAEAASTTEKITSLRVISNHLC